MPDRLLLVPVTETTIAGHSAHFAEVHWDDLSGVKDTVVSIVKALFRLVFGMRHLVPAAAATLNARILHRTASFFFNWLRGPIFALTIYAYSTWLFLTTASVLSLYSPDDQLAIWVDSNTTPMFVGFSAAVSLASIALYRTVSRDSIIRSWTVLCLIFLSALGPWTVVFSDFEGGVVGLLSSRFFPSIVVTWLVANFAMLFAIVVVAINLRKSDPIYRHSHKAIGLSIILSMAFWVACIPALFIASYFLVHEEVRNADLYELMIRSVQVVGWTFLIFVLSSVSAGFVWWKRRRWAQQIGTGCSPHSAPPRLILNDSISNLLLIAPLLLVPIFIIVTRNNLCTLPDALSFTLKTPEYFTGLQTSICGEFGLTTAYILASTEILNLAVVSAIPVILFFFPAMRGSIRLIFDILLDIVNYFRPSPRQEHSLGLPDVSKEHFVIRDTILKRVRRILDHYATGETEGQELVLVSHSQGTIFALDFLADPLNHDVLQRFAKVKLVTMGSPYTHLYQHYFPALFLNPVRENELRRILGSGNWRNLYTTDDYVGTFINLSSTESGKVESEFPENVELGPGGHTGYFSDRRAITEIRDFVYARAPGS